VRVGDFCTKKNVTPVNLSTRDTRLDFDGIHEVFADTHHFVQGGAQNAVLDVHCPAGELLVPGDIFAREHLRIDDEQVHFSQFDHTWEWFVSARALQSPADFGIYVTCVPQVTS